MDFANQLVQTSSKYLKTVSVLGRYLDVSGVHNFDTEESADLLGFI